MKRLMYITSFLLVCCLFVPMSNFVGTAEGASAEEKALLWGIIGQILSGDNDSRNYKGKMTGGGYYEGSIKDKLPHGYGKYQFPSGDEYVGEFQNGKIHGQGTFTWTDGDKYVGEFQNHNIHGQGTYIWANGNKYVGEWQNGKQHGQGTETYGDGDKYVGEWQNGKQHGQGTYTWANGNKYVGESQDGKKHGQGTQTNANGDKYVGEWQYDKRHGHGTFTKANGSSYECEWREGSAYGEIVETDTNNIKLYHVTREDGKIVEDYQKNISSCTVALKQYPNNTNYLNRLAWYLATCPDSKYRNGNKAVTLANKAVSLEKDQNNYLNFLDTLAAAYAEAGRFNEAVKTQEKAIELLKLQERGKDIPSFEKRLESYKAKKPWRDN